MVHQLSLLPISLQIIAP